MKHLVVAAAVSCLVAGVTSASGSPNRAQTVISVWHGAFTPAPDEPALPLGQRDWYTKYWITLDGPRPCDPLVVHVHTVTYFNRELVSREFAFAKGVKRDQSVINTGDTVTGTPGDTILVRAEADCTDGRLASNVYREERHVPRHSCQGGPWHVIDIEGKAFVEHEPPHYRRLAVGDLLRLDDLVHTRKDGTVAFGARKCNRTRYTLSPKSSATVGDYQRGREGTSTDVYGTLTALVGRHGGGISAGSVRVRPRGRPSLFQVTSRSPRVARIRVYTNRVVISRSIKKTRKRLVGARAGDLVLVKCTPDVCTVRKRRAPKSS